MVLGGSCVGEAPSLPPARPSARSMTWPRNSSPLSAGSAANPSAWPQLRALGSIPVAPASVGALRHPRAPQGQRAAGFTARARAASSAVCNPAGEEGIAATSRPGGFQGGGPSRGCGAPSRRARARAPAPTCPCGPGECGSRSRAASRVPARRHRLSAHYVMPRHAPVQPTRARAPPNVNTARTWLARPGHVRGGPGRRHRAALR